MNKFSEAARTAYEQYLLSKESVEDVLLKMLPGSKYHDYLKIIDALKKQKGIKGKLPFMITDMIAKFKKKHKGSQEAKRVDFQSKNYC
jgi:ABC-type lipoprotein release transport system permease subunit